MMSFGKAALQSAWMLWEKGFERLSRWRSAWMAQFGICKVVVRQHRGESISCRDGTWIHRGDWVGELHLDNREVLRLLRSAGSERTALLTARLARDSLREISAALESRPELAGVKALVGITLLHRGIVHGLGFERHALESRWFERMTTWYLRILLRIMHPEGGRRIRQRTDKLVPVMLIHTRTALLARFSARPAA
jgi:hypothetical protein